MDPTLSQLALASMYHTILAKLAHSITLLLDPNSISNIHAQSHSYIHAQIMFILLNRSSFNVDIQSYRGSLPKEL